MKRTILLLTILSLITMGSNAQRNWKWNEQSSNTNNHLRDVFFTDTLNGWAVGTKGTIINTSNGGQTWTSQVSGTDEELESVHFVNKNYGWITGGGVSARPAPMLRTTDGGATWDSIDYGFRAYNIRDIFFVNENIGWAIVSDSIYRSIDGGETWISEKYWTEIKVSSLWHRQLFATSDTTAYIAGKHNNGSTRTQATIFDRRPHSEYLWGTDGFNQFDRDETLRCITFASPTVGFSGGQLGKVYKSDQTPGLTNGPWDLNLELDELTFIWSISFADENIGMFNASTEIDGTTIALIYHTDNQGETWTSKPDSIYNIQTSTLHAPDTANAWVVGSFGKIFKGKPSIKEDEEVPPSALFSSNAENKVNLFPNPTQGLVSIQNPNKHSDIHVKVLTASGQMLSEFVVAADKEVLFELTGEAGIYFIHTIDINGKQKLLKLIKQ